MIGLSFVVARAIWTKFFGLPKFSMYARMIFVSGSPRHICNRSFKLTWALFPSEQNFANPTPKVFACSRIAIPKAPLCVTREIPPRSGGVGAKVASIRTSGWVLMTPMQFGPIIVSWYSWHRARSRASRSIPTPPTSRNPAVITTRPFTPFFPHASAASRAKSAGTVITARSTGSGTSRMLGYARMPWMPFAFGFTG